MLRSCLKPLLTFLPASGRPQDFARDRAPQAGSSGQTGRRFFRGGITRNALALAAMCGLMPAWNTCRAEQTPDGMKIISAWTAPRPREGAMAVGFPLLTAAEHATVFAPNREDGAYNHHAELIRHRGCFFAMWSNHPHAEDGPGQRVLFASARQPGLWTPWRELFPAPGVVLPKTPPGPRPVFASALMWQEFDGKLYAVAATNTAGPIAREVSPEGALGPIFRLWPGESPLAFDCLPASDERVSLIASVLQARIGTPEFWPWWDFWDRYPGPLTANGRQLVEPTVHQARDGRHVMLLRDSEADGGYSHRVFMSVSRDGGKTWPPALPTDIPDTPSRRDTVRLPDGTILLIGNQVAPTFDNGDRRRHYDRDPLTIAISRDGYVFERVHALRWDLPRTMRINGITGRGPGAQYPSAVVHDGVLYVLYSVGKEDIGFSWVALKDLGLAASYHQHQFSTPAHGIPANRTQSRQTKEDGVEWTGFLTRAAEGGGAETRCVTRLGARTARFCLGAP